MVPQVEGEEAEGYVDRVKMLRNRLVVAALLTVPLGDLGIVLALAPQMRFPGWQWVLLVAALLVVTGAIACQYTLGGTTLGGMR